jgi:uncharacterized phage-associated protein
MDHPATIDQIADYIIDFAHERGAFISNLKLQKLVYYVQAWHLALKERPLFDGEFEAWLHGPVNPTLYQRFKIYRYNSIGEDVAKPNLAVETEAFVLDVLAEYFELDAYQLERLTHQETPWMAARGDLHPSSPSAGVISQDHMREYYRAHAAE